MRSALSWFIMQRVVGITYRHFGTTYKSKLQESRTKSTGKQDDWVYIEKSCNLKHLTTERLSIARIFHKFEDA